ncbi:MAG: MiaB/RimO family radical SAM methylthiotransferase [Kiritimatiellae bacterium]|nr:MiaB/RimO family radical SAM methylthiotransferase [Kiritimatiellia bacterium]
MSERKNLSGGGIVRSFRPYHLWTIGCAMNEADSRRLSEGLREAGWLPCPDPRKAELLILNTCVVRQQAEDRARRRLGYCFELKKYHPEVRIALMGCMVGSREGPAARARDAWPEVDFFVPPSDPEPLLRVLRAERKAQALSELETLQQEARVLDAYAAPSHHARSTASSAPAAPSPVCAQVPVVLGCSHACTYCIIPYRRGRERSRPEADVLEEAARLSRAGARELVLLGQIVDRYGHDLPGHPTLDSLIREIARLPDVWRIRFLTSHPNYLTDAMIDAVARTPKACPHFELPVQAGDDEILERMRRGYTVDDFRVLVARIRSRIPTAAIQTDMITGFPGETTEQFERSLALLEELRLDKVHLAKYSPRPDTYAARRFTDDVPPEEKERRLRRLDDAQRTIQTEKNARIEGGIVEVLVEGYDEKRGRWSGRDRHDRWVFFPDPRNRHASLAAVRITRPAPFAMVGEPAD